MKKIFILILLINGLVANAQIGGGWDWAINTGSFSQSIKHLSYQSNGDILIGGSLLGTNYLGGTTVTVPDSYSNVGTMFFLGKIVNGTATVVYSINNVNISWDCVTTDSSGNYYVGGGINTTTAIDLGNGVTMSGFLNTYIAKFNSNGIAQWAKTFDLGSTTGSASKTITRLAVSKFGNIFFTGLNPNMPSTAGVTTNMPLYKLDIAGNIQWFKNSIKSNVVTSNNTITTNYTDKFVDDEENVHLFLNTAGNTLLFDGETIVAPVLNTFGSTTYAHHLSYNSMGVKRFVYSYRGAVGNFYVDRASGNITFGWSQVSDPNPNGFVNLPLVPFSPAPVYANYFKGIVSFDKNENRINAKDFSGISNNPFRLIDPIFFIPLANGKLLLTQSFTGNAFARVIGTDYIYPIDAANAASAIIETDANWDYAKMIVGGKAPLGEPLLIAAQGSTYAMVASFGVAPPALPTTTYGTTTLNGFNAVSNFTTAYGVYSTSLNRLDVAFVQTKSANFPTATTTTWLGNSTNWNTPTNWTNGVPTAGLKALFNSGTTNSPTTFNTPTAGILQVNTGGVVTLPATLTVSGGIKNDGTIKINNAGFFQGFGATEFKGNGSVEFLGTAAASFYYANTFTNNLILNSPFATYYNLTIGGVTFNAGAGSFNLVNKTLSITDPSPTSITGTSPTSYFYGGILKRAVNSTGNYEFAVGSSTSFQSTTINANNLAGVSTISTSHTAGAVSGTLPNTSYNGVSINQALNGGWFTISPNAQPTSGSYNVTLQLLGSTNTIASPNRYAVIKRDDNATGWAVQGNYVLPTVSGSTVTATANGLTSFSDFAIGIGASTLPITLTSFTAKALNTTAILNWSTATEYNNKGYAVQHSTDGTNFITIAFVNSRGNSVNNTNYTYVHNSPVDGKNYYRLQAQDYDGKTTLSPIEMVNIKNTNYDLNIFPNPTSGLINIVSFNKIASIELINKVGSIVKKYNAPQISISMNDLPNGIYILKSILKSGEVINQKIILEK